MLSVFQPFEMERMMSKYEQEVEYNLSESGVHPISLGELLAGHPQYTDRFLSTELGYPHVNGTPGLRENIAALYGGARAENILVTAGAIEANYITIRTLLSAGDEIVIVLPNYMQIWGIAKNHGLQTKTIHLREEDGWALDLDLLKGSVTSRTRLVAVCNPNNPTGRILTEQEMDAVVTAAGNAGAWILADEVYRGAERLGDGETTSFYGTYERVIAVGSLSKAYGLPGLRIGWAAGPVDTLDNIWARHEYTTISAARLSNDLAEVALCAEVRPRLIERTRRFIRNGYAVLEEWMNGHVDTFSLTPPQAGAIAFIRYHLDINSTEFTERLRREKSTLIVPGDHFGMDNFVRISFGLPRDYLVPALERIRQLVTDLRDR